jgi:hypothetical protein
VKILLRSFAAGEITPELYGRVDLTKNQTGLALCQNFEVRPHGPATRRPGYEHVVEVKTTGARLIPFAFSADQTVVLEFGNAYLRFHIAGDTLLEAGKAIVSIAADLVTVTGHGYAVGKWVFIGGRFYKVATTPSANTFTVDNLDGTNGAPTGATAAQVYEIATGYATANLFKLHYAQDSDVLTVTSTLYPARDLARGGATSWTITDIDFAPSAAVPTGVGVVATVPTATNLSPQKYVVTAIAADQVTESLASSIATASNNLSIAGNYNTLSWSAVAGATRYNVYKQRGGSFGYIGQTVSLSIVDDNVLADLTKSPPEDIFELNTGAGDYPAAVTYYEQRRWFAGTADEPQTIWATRNGTQSNLTSSLPSQDDDGLEFRIAAQQQNAIRHLLPLTDMIALTAGGEFRVFSDNAPSITPTSLSIKPQGFSGASDVQPVLTSGSILYVQAQGSRVREFASDGQSATASFKSVDVSILAPHLFDGYTIIDMAYSRAPDQTLWAVRSDGVLLGLSYVPDQQVYGWHQHTTDGLFKSVCTVAEGSEDVLYAVIERTINGRTMQLIERRRSRLWVDAEDAFYVDSGMTYDGVPTSSITGLWHLEGETVSILADAAVHPTRVVTNGAVTLDASYSVVHIGLPYSSRLRTLPLSMEAAAAGQGTRKNVNEVHIRVAQSSLVKAGSTFDKLTSFPARAVSDDYGQPPALRTGELSFKITPTWSQDGAVCVEQDQPLPLTVLSMTLDVTTGG